MPRRPREKDSEAIYHVMCRSLPETLLYRDDEDKDFYLKLLKINSSKYKCSIYAFCLMDNHVHIHLDPKGYDISSFMHSINTTYVIYYNKKYNRYGHLFQDRFKSIIINSDRYNLALSAYIHNNPKNIEGYKGRVEQYKYSSYGIYLGMKKDVNRLVDTSFIKSLFGVKNKRSFIRRYKEFVSRENEYSDDCHYDCRNDADYFEKERFSERKIISREISPSKVVDYIASKLHISKNIEEGSCRKKNEGYKDQKAFTAYVLRAICGMRYRQICEFLLDITLSNCSRLCNKGFELLERGGLLYSNILNDLLLINFR